MNSILKPPLVVVILGLALQSKLLCAEASSRSNSTAGTQNQKTAAKSTDQPDAGTSAGTRTDSVKDSTASHPLEQSAAGQEDPISSAAALQGPALFKLLDTDKDGRISSAEFIAYGKAADPSTGSLKNSPGGNACGDSTSGSTSSNTSAKSNASKTDHSDREPAAKSELASTGAGILTTTDTRAGKFTAEVFEILDINHDKFLSQAELDALIPAHQISQP